MIPTARRLLRTAPILFLTVLCAHPQTAPTGSVDPWGGFSFLVGDWIGVGGGGPGQATGEFSFQFELQRRILVRRNWAVYPASAGKPSFRHDDLMVLHFEDPAKPVQAVYFDNEGHVIRYDGETAQDGGSVRLVSRVEPGMPRFRLTYRRTGPDTIAGEFEIAPPGRPDTFATYLKWTARRK